MSATPDATGSREAERLLEVIHAEAHATERCGKECELWHRLSSLPAWPIDAWINARVAEVRRDTAERIALPKTYALRCASCGDKATTTIVLEGFRTPVCLRHYNVWRTPEFDAHMCGIACETCRDHDPRDRRDHGHLSPALCPACIAREEASRG